MRNTEPAISQDAAGRRQRSSQTRTLRDLFVARPRPTGAGQGDND